MIYLHELTITSFVLLRANWMVNKARQLINQSKATHVIIHRIEPDLYEHLTEKIIDTDRMTLPLAKVKDYYYLYSVADAQNLLDNAGDNESVRTAFNLHEHMATPVKDAYSDAETAPDCVIIMDGNHIVGFVDSNTPPKVRTKGLTRGSGQGQATTEFVPRSVKAEFPDRVPLQQSVPLLVSLSEGVESSGVAQGKLLPLAIPVGSKLDIIVQPKRGFILEGQGGASMVVSNEEEILHFKLKATELGPGEVRILAFNGTQRLGTIILKPLVVEAEETLSGEQVVQEKDIVPIKVHEPDLLLLILEEHSSGKTTLTFRLKALDPTLGLHLQPIGSVILHTNPQDYFNDFFEDIEKLRLDNDHDREIAQMKLAAKGSMLFQQVIPQDLQVLLWSLRNQIKSMQIQSAEPDIPWELCRLQGKENGQIIDGPFFCEAFALTRCLDTTAPKPTLSLKNLALVIPKDSGLPYAASERDYMLSLTDGGRKVERIPANFLDVKKKLATGEYDGWHFTGHGGFRPEPNRSAILLEKHEEMTPEDLSGPTENLGLANPLVFLNACQIGRSAMSLTDIGGWAKQFLCAGAGAFIGAYWSIYDKAANDFAKAFYGNLLSGIPIGRAVQQARLAIKPLGDPTWLAYTVFADPLACVI